MKIFMFLAYTCVLISTRNTLASLEGTIHAPLDLISLEDITPEERKQIAYLEYKLNRSKRSGSGSGDILGALTKAIGQGIKKKIGQIARASVSASGHFSSSSSSSGHSSEHSYSYHHPEHVPETYDHKSFDFWSLKTSILNTLLQAVKAIKGGVIAVKGQLIKGSGKLISVKGQLISQQGDSITQLGKNIASSAVLVPFKGHSSSGHEEYHHSAPSAPETIYHESPSAPGSDYHVPGNYPPPPHPEADGLLILKKIRGQHHADPHDVPPFKPLEPTGPSYGTIAGKLFSASTSLDPHKPEPFGNTAGGGIHYEHNSIGSEEHIIKEHKTPVPTTSYGIPFEQSPSYLNHNFHDYTASDSKNRPSYIRVDGSSKDSPPSDSNSIQGAVREPSQSSSSSEYIQPLVTGLESIQNSFEHPAMPASNSVISDYSSETYNPYSGNNLLQTISYKFPMMSNPNVYSGNPAAIATNINPSGLNLPDIADYPDGFPPSSDFSQSAPSSSIGNVVSPIYFQQSPTAEHLQQSPKPSPYLQTPHVSTVGQIRGNRSPTRLNDLDDPPKVSKKKIRSHSYGIPTVTKGLSNFRSYKPSSQNYELVQSMSFELGPNGPKRLT